MSKLGASFSLPPLHFGLEKMGKKKGKQEDDYWTSGFEQDLNDLVLNEQPGTPESGEQELEKKQPKKKSNKSASENKESKSTKEEGNLNEKVPTVTNSSSTIDSAATNSSSKIDSAATDPAVPPASQSETKAAAKSSRQAAHVEALKQMLARKQAAEAEQRKLEQEAEEQEKQRIRQKEIEREQQEALQRKQQEEERLKKAELKKQGLLLSKAQREKAEMNRIKLEQMKALGMVGATSQEGSQVSIEQKAKKPVYSKKKRQQKTEVAGGEVDKVQKTTATVSASWEDEVEDSEEEPLAIAESKVATKPEEAVESQKSEESQKIPSTKKEIELIRNKLVEVSKTPETSTAFSEPTKSADNLRSPICCILGHVDTGKTKLLDKIRQTNVQEGEAGGITQQIGATYFPIEIVKEKTKDLLEMHKMEYNVPGLLIIDTPGHESFTNLRSRGSSLCNIAILVVDITAGLEAQTLESLRLLKQRKTPFVVALNKVDRLYDWNPQPDKPIQFALSKQKPHVLEEYEDRVKRSLLALTEQGMNVELYYKNRDFRKYVSVVPTSAITGEGIPDLLMLIVQLTQKMMASHLRYQSEHFECTILEVKVIEGMGTTIDCILSNGILSEGDRIVVCGLNGPIVTTIRAILTPQPMREMRVKGQFVHHKTVQAALGIKIYATELEKAVAGSKILRIPEDATPEQEESIKNEVMADLNSMLSSVVHKTEAGVCVQASTLGSLEALLQFLSDMKIPVSGVNIGPVHKKDVVRASTMLERAPEYAMILAFDVKVEREAQELAEDQGIKIFTANIIYHLFDQFTAYIQNIQEERKRSLASQAIFPCVLKIVPGCIFNTRDPIILGITVQEGSLRIGTPLCVMGNDEAGQPSIISIGRVSSIEQNHKSIPVVRKGGPSVAIKIDHEPWDTPKMVGRHFGEKDELVSRISRQSIDILKEHFRDDVERDDWQLIIKLKKQLNIL